MYNNEKLSNLLIARKPQSIAKKRRLREPKNFNFKPVINKNKSHFDEINKFTSQIELKMKREMTPENVTFNCFICLDESYNCEFVW